MPYFEMTKDIDKKELGKKTAAYKAAEYIEQGMTVGLGSGSTVFHVIVRVGELVKEGLEIKCVSTSSSTSALAKECGIKLIELSETDSIDLTIDGADEIDPKLCGIKGGGGALLFEKIVALNSKRNIWIADSSKLVDTLGKFPLPVEVIPFGHRRVFRILEDKNLNPVIRKRDGSIYQTDSGNLIMDLNIGTISEPDKLDKDLKLINGVVETGIFCGIADMAIIAEGEAIEVIVRSQQ
jgi:ribose 5-phosphate isomerase A